MRCRYQPALVDVTWYVLLIKKPVLASMRRREMGKRAFDSAYFSQHREVNCLKIRKTIQQIAVASRCDGLQPCPPAHDVAGHSSGGKCSAVVRHIFEP
jgi:hypothetical protein